MNKNKTHYFLCGYIIVLFFLCLCSSGLAQEKSLKKIIYEQVYLDAKPYILKPAPRIPTSRTPIRAWLDDEHYLFSERDESEEITKIYKVNAKTGKKTPFIDYDPIQKTFPKGLKSNQQAGFTDDYSGLIHLYVFDLSSSPYSYCRRFIL